MALYESMLHRVVPSVLPPELALEIGQAASDTHGAMIDANSTWKGLDAYFSVQGAEGVFQMLERLVVDASNFSTAIFEGYSQLIQAEYTLYDLEQRRLRLIDDINDVNTQLTNSRSTLSYEQGQAAMVCYPSGSWAERQQEQDIWLAQRDVYLAEHQEEKIRKRIEKFNTDVENREGDIARGLANIRGGSDVHDEAGTPISRSKWSWGAPGASMSDLPMVERFERALTNQYIARLDWMLEQNPSSLEAWLATHPGFAAGAAMVDPRRISNWFDRHVAADSITEGWQPSGAWLTLQQHAPGAIGNLNGLPSIVRDNYNRAYLTQLLDEAYSDPDKYSKQIERLEAIEQQLYDRNGNALPDMYLLNLFLGNNEPLLVDDFGERMGMVFGGEAQLEPRAAIAYGNPDNADLMVTMTHGIRTDSAHIGDWIGYAEHVRREGELELQRRGYIPGEGRDSVSAIAWFGYDSQGLGGVNGIVHAEAGAQAYTQFQQGLSVQNASGSSHAWFHSYGTTMGGQALARSEGLVDTGYMMGSAGWTEQAANTLSSQPYVDLYASHSNEDGVAEWGRKPWLSSHAVDPRDVSGVTEIDASTGDVNFGVGHDGTDSVRRGYEPEGHDAGSPDPGDPTIEEPIRGYFSVDSRSFLEALDILADELQPTP